MAIENEVSISTRNGSQVAISNSSWYNHSHESGVFIMINILFICHGRIYRA